MMRRAYLIAAAAGLAGCVRVQSPLFPAGDQAQWQASLLGLMLWVCGGAYLLVMGFLGSAIWRSRRTLAAAGSPPNERGLAVSFAAWAGIITVALSALALASFLVDRKLATVSHREALQVRVTGHQWWWRIAYRAADGAWIETANELHLPSGRTARVELGSSDVIHSFWVPNVAGKMDLIPGRTNVLDLTPRRPGWFRGQCAEFCGLQHAHMALDVKVEPEAAFRQWLANEAAPASPTPADATIARGQAVMTQGACAACHTVRGTASTGRVGPDLTHIASRRSIAAGLAPFSRGALQGWIAQPNALKPGTMMPAVPLAPADADAVSRYLVTLR